MGAWGVASAAPAAGGESVARGVATGLEEKAKAEEAMAREHHQSRLLDSLLGKRSLRPLGLATAGLTRAAFADPTTTRRNRRASRARAPAEALA